jgi:hypothetical protein
MGFRARDVMLNEACRRRGPRQSGVTVALFFWSTVI